MKDLLANNAASIAILIFGAIGAYFMLQAHDEQIKALQKKDIEIEASKVSKSELALKETFAAAKMQTVETSISHIDQRLDKKIKVYNELAKEVEIIAEQTAVQEERIDQGERERGNLWKFTNKFLEEL